MGAFAEISVTCQARPVAVCILDNESIRAVNLELTLASDVATHSQTGKYSQTRYGDFAEIQETLSLVADAGLSYAINMIERFFCIRDSSNLS